MKVRAAAPSRTRGPKPKFTRDQIVEEGLRLIAEDGVERLTLRAVADRLSMSVMGLYRYFEDKDDLLDAMIAHALAPVATSQEGANPRAQLERAMHDFFAVLLDNAGLAQLCASHRPGHQVDDLRARLLAIAAANDLGDDTEQMLRVLTSFVMGSAIVTPVQAGTDEDKLAAFDYGLRKLLRSTT